MSMWLSGANRVGSSMRGQLAAEAKRQTAAATRKAGDDWLKLWTDALTPPAPVAAGKRKKRRK